MFDFLKRKKDNDMTEIHESLIPQENSSMPTTNLHPLETGADILNQDIYTLDKPTKRDVIVPKMDLPKEVVVSDMPTLDFDTIEVKSKPQTQSAMQLATFADLSTLAKRTPIFVFRDKKASTYFGIVEGKTFYLKK